MRFSALVLLALAASACTIHVVEQPASPVMVAEAPRVVAVPSPTPVPVVVERPAPVAHQEPSSPSGSVIAPPTRDTYTPVRVATKPTPTPFKPLRTPFKQVQDPEPRSASVGHLPRVRHKVQAAEPAPRRRAASTDVAQAQ
jgi:hypothetical protein